MQNQQVAFPTNNFNLPRLQYRRVVITSAQIFTLFTTPITFLAGLPGTFISLEKIQMYRDPGVAYIGATGNLVIQMSGITWFQYTQALSIGSAVAQTNLHTYPTFNSADMTAYIGLPWTAKLATADPTPGTGTNGIQFGVYFTVWEPGPPIGL